MEYSWTSRSVLALTIRNVSTFLLTVGARAKLHSEGSRGTVMVPSMFLGLVSVATGRDFPFAANMSMFWRQIEEEVSELQALGDGEGSELSVFDEAPAPPKIVMGRGSGVRKPAVARSSSSSRRDDKKLVGDNEGGGPAQKSMPPSKRVSLRFIVRPAPTITLDPDVDVPVLSIDAYQVPTFVLPSWRYFSSSWVRRTGMWPVIVRRPATLGGDQETACFEGRNDPFFNFPRELKFVMYEWLNMHRDSPELLLVRDAHQETFFESWFSQRWFSFTAFCWWSVVDQSSTTWKVFLASAPEAFRKEWLVEYRSVIWDGNGLAYSHRNGFGPVSDQCLSPAS